MTSVITLTPTGMAKLFGGNPELYSDHRLLMLGRMLRYLGRRWQLLGTDDELGMDAWHREKQVRELYDRRYNELNAR